MSRTIEDAKELNEEKGFYFFSEDTMSFFQSEVETDIIHEEYFITSEKKCFRDFRRVFTIRKINWETGDIRTVQRDLSYLSDAEDWLEEYLQGE